MNEWEIVAAVLGAGLIPCIAVASLVGVAAGLVALEIAGTVLSTILMALAEGLQRQPFIDLALTLALVSMVGAFALARLLEHDL